MVINQQYSMSLEEFKGQYNGDWSRPMSKVYVIQDDGRKNLTPAMQIGEIVVLAQRDLPLHGDNSIALARLRRGLKEFNPENDYILLVGDPLLIGAAVAHLAMKFGKVRCLKWDRQNTTYLSTTMNFRQDAAHFT
jgi:uncharacterized transporter YbjL